jgi:hypothetical protein
MLTKIKTFSTLSRSCHSYLRFPALPSCISFLLECRLQFQWSLEPESAFTRMQQFPTDWMHTLLTSIRRNLSEFTNDNRTIIVELVKRSWHQWMGPKSFLRYWQALPFRVNGWYGISLWTYSLVQVFMQVSNPNFSRCTIVPRDNFNGQRLLKAYRRHLAQYENSHAST